MKFKVLNYGMAHDFVNHHRNARWEGWEIVLFHPNPRARTDKDGRYHEGRWGFESRFSVNSNGEWVIPIKYVKSNRNSRPRSR